MSAPRRFRPPVQDLFLEILRLGLAVLFLYSGLVKAGASEQFLVALGPFTLLPQWALALTAQGLPWIEVGVGLLLLWRRSARVGAGIAFLLLVIFIAMLGWALSQGIIVSCSCFGGEDSPSALRMITTMLRDALLALAALTYGLKNTTCCKKFVDVR